MRIQASTFIKVPLDEICKISIGKTPSRSNPSYWGNGHIWLSIGDLNGSKSVEFSKEEITEIAVKKTAIKIVKKGTLLFSFKLSIGKVAFAGKDLFTNEAIAAFSIKDNQRVDENYLYYVLREFDFTDLCDKAVKGKTLNKNKLKRILIPLPSLSVQHRIATILDHADTIRCKNREILEKYNQLAQSVFLEMFGDITSNPKGWQKIKLEKLGKLSSGSTPSRDKAEYYNGEIPWVKTGEVNGTTIFDTEEKISQAALKNSSCKIYPRGSIIIAMYGQGITRGKVGILGIEATTNQACAVIPPNKILNSIFLFSFLKMAYNNIREMGRGGNQPNLNVGMLKEYEIFNPPHELQTHFSELISKIESQRTLTQQSLQKSEELFQSLLQRAFRGEL